MWRVPSCARLMLRTRFRVAQCCLMPALDAKALVRVLCYLVAIAVIFIANGELLQSFGTRAHLRFHIPGLTQSHTTLYDINTV